MEEALCSKPPASPFWGEVKPLDDSSTYFRKIRPNSKFCLQQGRTLQTFLTYNAGGAGYKMELVISADKDKKFTPISIISPGFLQTSSEQESPTRDNHVRHHSSSEDAHYGIPCRYHKWSGGFKAKVLSTIDLQRSWINFLSIFDYKLTCAEILSILHLLQW